MARVYFMLIQACLIWACLAGCGSVDVVDLPKAGIHGNSHMMMMDKNSDQVAGVIQKWLADHSLYQ